MMQYSPCSFPSLSSWKPRIKDKAKLEEKESGLWMIEHSSEPYFWVLHEWEITSYWGKPVDVGIYLLYQGQIFLSFLWFNWQILWKSGQEHRLWCHIDLSLNSCSANLGCANLGKLLNLSESLFSHLWKDDAYLRAFGTNSRVFCFFVFLFFSHTNSWTSAGCSTTQLNFDLFPRDSIRSHSLRA